MVLLGDDEQWYINRFCLRLYLSAMLLLEVWGSLSSAIPEETC